MKQEKKERIGWVTFLILSIGLGVGNFVFWLYCLAYFFTNKFGPGAGVPAVLLYIFANTVIIAIATEVLDWSVEGPEE